jgi:hypothetical protein
LDILVVRDNEQLDGLISYPNIDFKRSQAGRVQADQDPTATMLHQWLGGFDDLRQQHRLPPRGGDLLAGIDPGHNRRGISDSGRERAWQRCHLLTGQGLVNTLSRARSELRRGNPGGGRFAPAILPGLTAAGV